MASLDFLLRPVVLFFLLLQLTYADRKQPNIILILTDDQDQKLQSLDYMPLLKKYTADQGTTFNKHYCTVSICCPSRVNLWTGRAAHNTNVTDVVPPFGKYAFCLLGVELLVRIIAEVRVFTLRGRDGISEDNTMLRQCFE
jgi:hypothetical protein